MTVVAAVTGSSPAGARVDEVWIAIDAGLLINPDRAPARREGSVMNGLNHLLYGGVTHKAGAVQQSNFGDMPIVRTGAAPRRIHVELMLTSRRPGGVGGPGVPPVAPAVADAIFALTGKRIREFGFQRPL